MASYGAGPPYPAYPQCPPFPYNDYPGAANVTNNFSARSNLDVSAMEFVPGSNQGFRPNPRQNKSDFSRGHGPPKHSGRFYGRQDRSRQDEPSPSSSRSYPTESEHSGNERTGQKERRPHSNYRPRQWVPQYSSRDNQTRAAMIADTAAFLASTSSSNVTEQGQQDAPGSPSGRQPSKYYNRSHPSNSQSENNVKWNGSNNSRKERDRNGGNWSRSRPTDDYELDDNSGLSGRERNFYRNRERDFDSNRAESGDNDRSRKQNYSYNNERPQGKGFYNSGRNNYEKRKNNYYGEAYSSRNHGSQDFYRGGPSNRDSRYNSNNKFRQSSQDQTLSKDCDEASQRERLIEQLTRGTLECLVCCDRVQQKDFVWSCANCFHVLHLRCVTKWAQSSKEEAGWRCPACQNVTLSVPSEYRCFCGKLLDPKWNRQDTPHSCGEVCGKSRKTLHNCTHHCLLLCHPGPCPPCNAQVTRKCGCGKTSSTVKCSTVTDLVCSDSCDKTLNCGVHKCALTCHNDSCPPCEVKIKQDCFCSKKSREVDCIPENQGITVFSCGDTCGRTLLCGKHECVEICHEGPCKICELIPENVTHCPCGKMELKDASHVRESCTDPIPTCGKVCQKKLNCGQPSAPHCCQAECHTGPCPPCDLTTLVRCRCGNMDKKIPCAELTTKADDARCGKKCTKKRSCGKHRCNQLCCIEIDHPCPLPCNHLLSCGQHRCEQLCHCGRCRPCWRTGFDELYCYCGAAVQYPPIPCGTKPPLCTKPCTRQHDCEHAPLHNCHSDPTCPPCTVLTQRVCHGGHETRKSVPCHQKELSCGRPCNKELPCGRHRCLTICHKGECLTNGAVCTQPCTNPRPICTHPCGAPCHEGKCPETPCKVQVKVTCECGNRSTQRVCAENTREYQRVAIALLASKMDDMHLGLSVDLADMMNNPASRKLYFKPLDCNDECKQIERNQRLAISLQIRNPDLGAKLTPRYSDFMRDWGKKDPAFAQMVHDRLTELVKLAKDSKQKSRSYSFKEMGSAKRQFVHEYCEHFGCESAAYDQEPKRNVVATAQRDKAWLPSVSLLELIQREQGQKKVPGPVLSSMKRSPAARDKTMESLAVKWPTVKAGASTSSDASSYTAATSRSTGPKEPEPEPEASTSTYIDYFNL